ncbi:uncharacterized protein LOC119732721 [Patiria miniata]|uniref:Ig-like domain-containing protein n=1 Tax=Patiria miniata TaxID=46514 RepID=A0A914AF05_PATMI|nr:uncharacterized protein LOC119732721 [Patiria miniata]
MERILNLRTLLMILQAWAIVGFVSFDSADSLTSMMTPREQKVPEGEIFELKCVSRRVLTNGSRVRNELYKVEGDSRSYLSPSEANAGETNYTMPGPDRATVTTIFRLQAKENSAGRYGCVPILENATRPATFTSNQKRREVTVQVCSEPELEVEDIESDGELIYVGAESCGYNGELTWRVNGRQAPRRSTPDDERFPVVEREDSSLKIRSARCHDETIHNTCEVTAVFTYISAEKRVTSASKTKQIPDCCVQDVFLPTTEIETNADTTTKASSPAIFPTRSVDVDEKEVLALEKQVLKLKLEALPMQIRFLRRLNRDHSQGRDMEKVEDI